jgi:hypothetical protein
VNQDLFENARWLIGAIARGLHARSGEGVAEVLARLSAQAIDEKAFHPPEPSRLPVLRYLPDCIGEAMLLDADLAAAIASIEDDLQWRQSSSYSDKVLGEGFTDNYGWTEIIGPRGFFPGDDFLLGLLMLGPHRHYKDHYHPAPELYWPLTGPSDWKQGAGGFETREAGSSIWHIPWKVHATITDEKPLLAVWSWTRDTMTPAKLVGQ